MGGEPSHWRCKLVDDVIVKSNLVGQDSQRLWFDACSAALGNKKGFRNLGYKSRLGMVGQLGQDTFI
jgi:hypothetical protein